MLIRFRTARRISAVVAGAAAVLAVTAASNADAATQISSRPSVATPYCEVLLTGHHEGPERCAATRALEASLVSAATTLISIDYMDAGFEGSSLRWTVKGLTSCSSHTFSVPTMPSGWDNDISSYQDYANCGHNPHFANPHYGGASINCGPHCTNIGPALNDRTSSEKWS